MKKLAHKNFYLLLSYLLIGLGIVAFCYGTYLLWLRFKPVKFDELQGLVQSASESSASDSAQLAAVQLHVPDREIHLPLIAGSVNERGDWKLSEDAGLVIQSRGKTATESGTIVYAHNFPRLLGGLHKVQVGDQVEMVMSDWSTKQFVVVDVAQVNPSDVESVIGVGDDQLVMYTCGGFLDTKRLVVRAEPI